VCGTHDVKIAPETILFLRKRLMPLSITLTAQNFAPTWAIRSAWNTHSDWHGWSQKHWHGVAFATATVLLALLAQITLLSGWHLGAPLSTLALNPVNAGVKKNTDGALVYAFPGTASVAATSSISAGTDQILALTVNVNRVPDQTVMTVGWVSTRDLKRPPSLLVRLPPTNLPKSYTVLLRGHPQWQDNATQMAVALSAPANSGAVTITSVDVIPATPFSSIALAARYWFGEKTILSPTTSAQRILPLTAWFVLACCAAFALIILRSRGVPTDRAHMVVGAAIAFMLIALFSALIAPDAFTLSRSALSWIAASLAICMCASPWHAITAQMPDDIPKTVKARIQQYDFAIAASLALAMSMLAIALGGWSMSWIAAVVLILLVDRRFPEMSKRFLPLLFFAPIVFTGVMLQGSLPWLWPELRASLVDPSATFAGIANRSAGVTAFLIGAFVANRAWPSAFDSQRYSRVAGVAAWYVLLSTVLILAMPLTAQRLAAGTGAAWVALPLVACVALFVMPAFKTRTAHDAVATTYQKTENDLSNIVRSMFDGALGSFNQAISSERSGTALAPLMRMREIAPASLITHAANLRYSLTSNDLNRATESYAILKSSAIESLPDDAATAIVKYAHNTSDYATVLSHAPTLEQSATHTRILAHAQLIGALDADAEAGRQAALTTLRAFPDQSEFAREITELHLLVDEWQLAQQALALSGIDIASLPGQTYVARLGMRATSPHPYADTTQKNAMWHPDLGILQAAMGDLLRLQGNANGARARYLLAVKIDASLWVLQPLIKKLESQMGDTAQTTAETNDLSKGV
jgi:hypothetical protein